MTSWFNLIVNNGIIHGNKLPKWGHTHTHTHTNSQIFSQWWKPRTWCLPVRFRYWVLHLRLLDRPGFWMVPAFHAHWRAYLLIAQMHPHPRLSHTSRSHHGEGQRPRPIGDRGYTISGLLPAGCLPEDTWSFFSCQRYTYTHIITSISIMRVPPAGVNGHVPLWQQGSINMEKLRNYLME